MADQPAPRLDYGAALAALMARPLAIAPEYLQPYLHLIAAGAPLEAAMPEAATPRPAPVRSSGGTAVIPIVGPIQPREDFFSMFFGLATVEGITRSLRQALAEPGITSIVLDIDSPGGDVGGIFELAEEIFAARDVKPITAVANTWMASAAYAIGSQATELVVTPSGMAGSIGVITVHADFSRALDMDGITPTVLTAGKYKGESNPYQPLSADAAGHIQSQLDEYHSMFVDAVARGRKVSAATVRAGFGQGRMVMAKEAVRLGMADRVATFDTVLARHAGNAGGRTRAEDDAPQITAGDKSPELTDEEQQRLARIAEFALA